MIFQIIFKVKSSLRVYMLLKSLVLSKKGKPFSIFNQSLNFWKSRYCCLCLSFITLTLDRLRYCFVKDLIVKLTSYSKFEDHFCLIVSGWSFIFLIWNSSLFLVTFWTYQVLQVIFYEFVTQRVLLKYNSNKFTKIYLH